MYHYVRDLPNTEYPAIKGLLTGKFEQQLDYLARYYEIIDICDVVKAQSLAFPPNACILTFDDGFIDHYETVFPILMERGMSGAFFPPVSSAMDREMLDVHKIHFILASTELEKIEAMMLEELDRLRARYRLPSNEELSAAYTKEGRFDGAAVTFIKRTLQFGIPRKARSEIAASLFSHFVTEDEKSFAEKLYMDIDQLREMVTAGMTIGGHGVGHNWLGKLARKEQELEFEEMMSFLTHVYRHRPNNWVLSYPNGSYNADTIELAQRNGACVGLKSTAGLVADFSKPFELDRLDTNDLPHDSGAVPCAWSRKVLSA